MSSRHYDANVDSAITECRLLENLQPHGPGFLRERVHARIEGITFDRRLFSRRGEQRRSEITFREKLRAW